MQALERVLVWPRQGWEHAVLSHHGHQPPGTVEANGGHRGAAIPPLAPTLSAPLGCFSSPPLERGAYLGKAGLCRSACPPSRCWAGHAGTGGRGQLSPAGSSAHTPPNRPSLPSPRPHFPLGSQPPSPFSSASSPCSLSHSGPSQVSCGLCPMGK